ncbi:hypothetical protein AKO1_015679 [Acrasis kona]|uniref:Histone deacetylase domain-containing protein n=1 Tax=Acrasis kona TaxID=1008807 RepID=A0AAW2ZFS1_9EUKA
MSRVQLKIFSTIKYEKLTSNVSAFPFNKYRILPSRLVKNKIVEEPQIITDIKSATIDQLILAHSPEYVAKYMNGSISEQEIKRIGVKWSTTAVDRALRVVGASTQAAEESLKNGASANLAGGQHHAHHDFGSGYSVFNDIVVAAETFRRDGLLKKWLCIDLDVHQGDGTATITKDWSHAFTLSVHSKKVFPLRKCHSSVDVELESGVGDEEYLSTVQKSLNDLEARVRSGTLSFELLMYQSGVDILDGDGLGNLKVSLNGCKIRDEMVMDFAKRCGQVPVCCTLGGGYPNKKIHDPMLNGMQNIIEAHCQTIQALKKYIS